MPAMRDIKIIAHVDLHMFLRLSFAGQIDQNLERRAIAVTDTHSSIISLVDRLDGINAELRGMDARIRGRRLDLGLEPEEERFFRDYEQFPNNGEPRVAKLISLHQAAGILCKKPRADTESELRARIDGFDLDGRHAGSRFWSDVLKALSLVDFQAHHFQLTAVEFLKGQYNLAGLSMISLPA